MSIVTTTVVWNTLLSVEDDAAVKAKALQMFEAGLAVSESALTSPKIGGIYHNVAPITSVRSWHTLEAAQEWATFLAPYNPHSVTINS